MTDCDRKKGATGTPPGKTVKAGAGWDLGTSTFMTAGEDGVSGGAGARPGKGYDGYVGEGTSLGGQYHF